ESGWGRRRPRRSTRSGPRRRSASTPRRAIAACGSSWSAASRRSSPSRRGSPLPRTWHAVSHSNLNRADQLFLNSPQMLARFFHSLSALQVRSQGLDCLPKLVDLFPVLEVAHQLAPPTQVRLAAVEPFRAPQRLGDQDQGNLFLAAALGDELAQD